MKEPLFIEVIKVVKGEFVNPQPHIERIANTTKHFFEKPLYAQLTHDMIPANLQDYEVVKCRIVYGNKIVSIDFEPYVMRTIKSLALVEHNTINYTYKYHNRELINQLKSSVKEADDILIIRNFKVTDTSFSNVVFEDYKGKLFTPKSTLLAGTKRKQLLKKGIIQEKEIYANDIKSYKGLYLINAMIDMEDNLFVNSNHII